MPPPYPNLNCPSRKDIELSPSGLPRRGSSLQKLKDFAPPFQKCSHRALFPLASAPAGCAAPHSTTRDHCGALRISFVRIPKLLIRARLRKMEVLRVSNRSIPKLARPVRRVPTHSLYKINLAASFLRLSRRGFGDARIANDDG